MPGKREDEVWRCFDRSKIGENKYFSGTCKGCGKVISGGLVSSKSLSCFALGLVDRLRQHADACEKLHEKKLWEKVDEVKAKKPKIQTLLTAGATTIQVFFFPLPNGLRRSHFSCPTRLTSWNGNWAGLFMRQTPLSTSWRTKNSLP